MDFIAHTRYHLCFCYSSLNFNFNVYIHRIMFWLSQSFNSLVIFLIFIEGVSYTPILIWKGIMYLGSVLKKGLAA